MASKKCIQIECVAETIKTCHKKMKKNEARTRTITRLQRLEHKEKVELQNSRGNDENWIT